MAIDNETRDRVRALVKQALGAAPDETVTSDVYPQRVVVNSLQEQVAREFDRDESAKSLITEDDLRGLDHGARLRVGENAKFTPLAGDIISEKAIQLIRKTPRRPATKIRTVAVGCDHGGFEVKEMLKGFLGDFGINVRDFGTNSKEAVDYPDFAHAVARAVGEHKVEIGIIIDGAGIGSAMTANKVPNVRAAACYTPVLARNSREHNGANVLTLGSGQNSFEEIKAVVEAFLTTELTEERHRKRVGKIEAIDREYKR